MNALTREEILELLELVAERHHSVTSARTDAINYPRIVLQREEDRLAKLHSKIRSMLEDNA